MVSSNFARIASIALLAAFGAGAQAAAITTLYSTGVDSTGALLAAGATDSHYSVTPGGGPFAIGSAGLAGSWVPNTASSQWISAAANTAAGGGPFTYSTTFDLAGFDASTAVIQFDIAADNMATIFLDGVQVATHAFPGWTNISTITLTSGFNAGLNTLSFVIPNNQVSANDGPTGLQVRIVTATADALAVPEPASAALVALALAGGVLTARRRRAC